MKTSIIFLIVTIGMIPFCLSAKKTRKPQRESDESYSGEDADSSEQNPNSAKIEIAKKFALASNSIGLSVISALHPDKNLVVSPFALSATLAILQYGARGTTGQEIRNALSTNYAGLCMNELDDATNTIFSLTDGTSAKPYDLFVSTRLYVTRYANEMSPTFVSELARKFHTELRVVDFSANQAGLINDANQWVSNTTHGRIPEIVNQAFPPDSSVVVLDVAYFNGLWEYPFTPDNQPGIFYNLGQKPVRIETMTVEADFNYFYDSFLKVHFVELPYKGYEMSMLLMIPEYSNDLTYVQNYLGQTQLWNLTDRLNLAAVKLTIPVFKLVQKFNMGRILQHLGVRRLFTAEANLAGFNGKRQLRISQFLHEASIELTPVGTEVKKFDQMRLSGHSMTGQGINLAVQKPFIFYIYDSRTAMIHFLGRVINL